HVSNIRRGELEDGISFLFSVEALELAVNMELVIRGTPPIHTLACRFVELTRWQTSPSTRRAPHSCSSHPTKIPARPTSPRIFRRSRTIFLPMEPLAKFWRSCPTLFWRH